MVSPFKNKGNQMPQVTRSLVKGIDGQLIWLTPKQVDVISVLEQCRAGGCAAVKGYVPETNYTVSPILNIQMITNPSYKRILERRTAALKAITFADIPDNTVPANKLRGKTPEQWFNDRMTQELESMEKTLTNDRGDAHRQGHDRCYVRFSDGIKVNLVTEKDQNGIMQPVLVDGYPTVASIMVQHLELNRVVVQEGVYKQVDSGASVLMKNAINKLLNARSVQVKTISLKEDNFERLTIDKNVVVPADIHEFIA
jgi:hypothetical protein